MFNCEQPTLNHEKKTLTLRPVVAAALAVAVIISLLATYYPVFDRDIQHLYATTNPDIRDIVGYAEKATAADIPRWWTSTWIQENSYYYRPLASMLIFAEYQLWGRDFQNYCLVSWLVHGLITILLFSFVYRLTADQGWRRASAVALLAVIVFNLRRGPEGPGWIPARVVFGEMPYWPAQTDIFSLLFALGSLLMLDIYTCSERTRWLAGAVGLYAAALLFKEMALALVFAAPLLVWYRRRRPPWLVGAAFAGLGVAFLVVRHIALPVAWNPRFRGLSQLLLKIVWYLNEPLFKFIGGGGYWVIPAAVTIIGIAYLIGRRRLDATSTAVWTITGSLLAALLSAQLVGGNFGRLIVVEELAGLGLTILFVGGAIVAFAARSRLAWMLAGLVVAVHLPILHVSGPHYLYWPAAFWGVLNAVLLVLAYDQWRAVRGVPPKKSLAQ